MKRIISLILIFIIFTLASCDDTTADAPGDDGVDEIPEITPYERALCLEQDVLSAMLTTRSKIELLYSDSYSYEKTELIVDNGTISLDKTDGAASINVVFSSDMAYIKTTVMGFETKVKRPAPEGEVLKLISDMSCRGISLSCSDFDTAVCIDTDGKTQVTCMLIKEESRAKILSDLDYDPARVSVDFVEYAFTVSDGKYEKISYSINLSVTNGELKEDISVSVIAYFMYGESYTVRLPDDIDGYREEN